MRNSARCLIWTVSMVCTVGAAELSAPSVSAARADSTPPVALNTCSVSTLSQPFAQWLDYAEYELVPGGDFESSTWTLAGGAELVAGSDPYAVTEIGRASCRERV